VEQSWVRSISVSIPKALEQYIDQSISQDFQILPISDEDKENESYKEVHRELKQSWTPILYERKVISDKAPVIPRVQYLLGFPPTDGLCIFAKKIEHKKVLCESPVKELAKICVLTQTIQYVLVEPDNFTVWGYMPICCCGDNCSAKALDLKLRQTLFE
jgi:hypothetical protein